MLTLNQRTYLCEFLTEFFPERWDSLWELSEKISDQQRRKLLALCYGKKKEELKSMLDEIINFEQYAK